jgi:hypothetical protein
LHPLSSAFPLVPAGLFLVGRASWKLGGDILEPNDHTAAIKLTPLVLALHDLLDKCSIPMVGDHHRLGARERVILQLGQGRY